MKTVFRRVSWICLKSFLLFVPLYVLMSGCKGDLSNGCRSDRNYLNLFKVLIRNTSDINDVKKVLAQHGFDYKEKIVSRFYSFRLRGNVKSGTCPINRDWSREIHNGAIISIVQDFEILNEKKVLVSAKAKTVSIDPKIPSTSLNSHEEEPQNISANYRHVRSTRNGRGLARKVTIGVVDNGFQLDHPNLVHAINRETSYDFIHDDPEPWNTPGFASYMYHTMKRIFIDASHGTLDMGIIVSKGLAGTECNQGINPNIEIVGIQIIDKYKSASDTAEAKALVYLLDVIDIISASVGIKENAGFVDIRDAAKEALREGVEKGRGCKGRLYFYPSGNGDQDNCNMDGYAKSVHTFTITNVDENLNPIADRVERCSCILAATIVNNEVKTTGIAGMCINGYEGSSFAVPAAAAYTAGLLEIRPDLTKRDVEHIIIRSASQSGFDSSIKWNTNGVGLKYNDRLGFGLFNPGKMVNMARGWHGVPEAIRCDITTNGNRFAISASSCDIRYLEHVEVEIEMCCTSCMEPDFGALSIDIQSPRGTVSPILTRSYIRTSGDTIMDRRCKPWVFMTYQFWGESPLGVWNVTWAPDTQVHFTLSTRRIILHGTQADPMVPNGRQHVNCTETLPENQTYSSNKTHNIPLVVVLVSLCVVVLIFAGIVKVQRIRRRKRSYSIDTIGQMNAAVFQSRDGVVRM